MSWRTFVCTGLLVVAGAGCKKSAKKEAPGDPNKCDYPAHHERLDGKGVPPGYDGKIFGVGDIPEDSYTSIEGHNPPRCDFVEGPNLKKQADGSLTTVAEGEVTGKCGSADTKYLVRKTAKLIPSTGTSIGGIGALTEPFTIAVGKERMAYAVRLDSCDRYIKSMGAGNARWKLGTCEGFVEAVNAEDLTKPNPREDLYLRGVKPGTCELEAEAGGVSMKFPITVTGDAAGSGAEGSAAGSADGGAAGSGEPGTKGAPPEDKSATRGAKKMSSDPEEGGEKK